MPDYRVKACALFPVHVGGGQDHFLDPLDYVVKDKTFFRLSLEDMFAANPDFAQQFVSLTDQSRVIDLRTLVEKSFDMRDHSHWIWKAEVSELFERTYNNNLRQSRNQLLVQCLPRTGAGAYIPGSSIKGAIRTAVLDQRAAEKGYARIAEAVDREHYRQRDSFVEAQALGADYARSGQLRPESDPFKCLKVSDCLLPPGCTKIQEVRNVPRDGKALALDMFVETVEPGTEFEFTVKLEDKAAVQRVKKKLTLAEIINDTAVYYQTAWQNEEEKFFQDAKASNWIDKIFAVNDEDNSERKTVIRVGRYSHGDFMTYNDKTLRRPRPPFDPRTKKPKNWGTTRNLIDGFLPLGAIRLEFC